MSLTVNARNSTAAAVRANLTTGNRDVRGIAFMLALLGCLLTALLMLIVLLWDVMAQAIRSSTSAGSAS